MNHCQIALEVDIWKVEMEAYLSGFFWTCEDHGRHLLCIIIFTNIINLNMWIPDLFLPATN